MEKTAEVASDDAHLFENFPLSVKNSEVFDVETVQGPQKLTFNEMGVGSSVNASFVLDYKNFSKGPNDEICPVW